MPPPLLTYACITHPFPLQASPASGTAVATLQVVATNATAAPVTLEGVSIRLPVGPAADALTLDPASIAVVPPAGWTQHPPQRPPGAILYTFLPGPGAGTVPDGGSLAFTLDGVEVSRQAGTATVTVTEGSGGCTPPGCPTASLAVTKFPAGWGNVEFRALDPDVEPGEDASVQWSGPAGATYTLRYYTPATGLVTVPAPNAAPLGSSGVYPGTAGPALPLWTTTVFTLEVAYTAGGNRYSAQRQVTVVVMDPAPTITRFDGQVSGPPGPPVLTLAWEASENALRYEISGVSQMLNSQGTLSLPNPVNPAPVLPRYTLTVHGAQGLTARAVFEVPPRITRFTGSAVADGGGMQLRLAWETWLGERCTITGVPGELGASGTVTVTPTAEAPLASDYTLTATARGKTDVSTLSPRWGTRPVAEIRVPGRVGTGIATAPDGTLLLAAASPRLGLGSEDAGPAEVLAFSGTTLQPLGPPFGPLPGTAGPIAVDPAGTRVYIAAGGMLAVFDAKRFAPVRGSPVALPIPAGMRALGVALSPGGDRVFVCSYASASVAVVDAVTLAVSGRFELPAPASGVATAARAGQLVFAGTEALYLVDARTYARSAPPVPIPRGFVRSLAVTPAAGLAVVAGLQAVPSVVDLRTEAVEPMHLPVSGEPVWMSTALAGSPDGSRLYAATTAIERDTTGTPEAAIQLSVFLRTSVSGGVDG